MALIKTIEEVKDQVSINLNNELTTILPDINFVEEQFIRDDSCLGAAQYDDLHLKYQNDDPLTPAETFLLEACQRAIANMAYGVYTTIGQVEISDSGIRIQSGMEYKTAFQWQVHDIQNNYFFKKGYFYIDKILELLEGAPSSYSLWKNSSAYTVFTEFFINKTADFHKWAPINESRRTFSAFAPLMRKVEEFDIKPVLGEEFFNEIKTEINSGTISAETQALLNLIQPATANLTIARAVEEMSLEATQNGMVLYQIASGTNNMKSATKPEGNFLDMKKNRAESDAKTYLETLVDKLNKEASDSKYTTYYESELYKEDGAETVLKQKDESKTYRAF